MTTDECADNSASGSDALILPPHELASAFTHMRLLHLLDGVTDACIVVDITGRIVYLNSAAERFTGWTRETAIGRAAGSDEV